MDSKKKAKENVYDINIFTCELEVGSQKQIVKDTLTHTQNRQSYQVSGFSFH